MIVKKSKFLFMLGSLLLFVQAQAQSNLHLTFTNNTEATFVMQNFYGEIGNWRASGASGVLNPSSIISLNPGQTIKFSLSHTDDEAFGSFNISVKGSNPQDCLLTITGLLDDLEYDLDHSGKCTSSQQTYLLKGDFGDYTIAHPDFFVSLIDHNE